MSSPDHHTSSNRLLAEIIIDYGLLNGIQDGNAKEPDDRQIDTSVHQSKRVAGTNDAVEIGELFKVALQYFYAG